MEACGKRYITHPSRTDVFTLWGIGDLHIGAPGCDLKSVRRDVAKIKEDPNSIWVGLGDYADFISPRDKRFAADALDDDAKLAIGNLGQHYMERTAELFEPIADKCLGLLLGNHEARYFQHNNREDGHGWLCTELGVPNLRYSALMDLVFVRKPGKIRLLAPGESPKEQKYHREAFRMYVHHGSGGAATPSGKLNTLIKHMRNFHADLYLMGHVHDQKGQRDVTLGANADCTKLVEHQKIGVICGSYLRTYTQGHTSYGEEKGYAPTSLGPAQIKIRPDGRELRGEV